MNPQRLETLLVIRGLAKNSPLHIHNLPVEIFQYILELTFPQLKGDLAVILFELVQRKKSFLIQLLIHSRIDIGSFSNPIPSPERAGDSLLYTAACVGDVSLFKLISRYAPAPDEEKYFLYGACEHGKLSMVQYLIENKASVLLPSPKGISPFLIACRKNNPEVVEFLLTHPIDRAELTSKLLLNSIGSKLASLLIENQADPNYVDAFENKKFAISHFPQDLPVFLSEQTPLTVAIKNENFYLIEVLIKRNANPNFANYQGMSHLLFATQRGSDNCVDALLRFKANPDQGNCHGVIIIKNISDVISLTPPSLITDISSFKSPLCYACQHGHVKIVKSLILHNADIELADPGGVTPLMKACQTDISECVQLLLLAGANFNRESDSGMKAVALAVMAGQQQSVSLLLEAKADPRTCVPSGKDLMTIAKENVKYSDTFFHVIDIIQEHITKRSGKSASDTACEPVIGRCLAKFDFLAMEENDLTFFKGDDIEVLATSENGWWTGRARGRIGAFPRNFVDCYQGPNATTNKKLVSEKAANPVESSSLPSKKKPQSLRLLFSIAEKSRKTLDIVDDDFIWTNERRSFPNSNNQNCNNTTNTNPQPQLGSTECLSKNKEDSDNNKSKERKNECRIF